MTRTVIIRLRINKLHFFFLQPHKERRSSHQYAQNRPHQINSSFPNGERRPTHMPDLQRSYDSQTHPHRLKKVCELQCQKYNLTHHLSKKPYQYN